MIGLGGGAARLSSVFYILHCVVGTEWGLYSSLEQDSANSFQGKTLYQLSGLYSKSYGNKS